MPRNKKSATASATESASEQKETTSDNVEVPSTEGQTSASAIAFGKQEASGRIRGPVEEVIAKRVRTLGKKIQRFKAYSAQPVEKLNADQKAAIASLPILEAQSRELEDLIKSGGAVEVAELGEAAKLRGMKEDAESKSKSDSESSATAFKKSLAEPLSRFLRLHSLLHPAKSTDHDHLTFSALDLPSHMVDEVQATDVLRVGRMYEDLLAGGEKAGEVLDILIKGSNGEDEENDHIHQLLELIFKSSSSANDEIPQQEESSPIDNDVSPAAEVADDDDDDDVIRVAPTSAIEYSESTLPVATNGDSISGINTDAEAQIGNTTESASKPKDDEPVPHPSMNTGKPLNFLQDDELDSQKAQQAESKSQSKEEGEKGGKGEGIMEDGFEVIPKPADHETEHYDVPTPAPTSADASAPIQDLKSSFDWTEDHEPAPIPGASINGDNEDKKDVAGEGKSSVPSPSAPVPSSGPGTNGGRGGRGGRGRGGRGGRGGGGQRLNGQSQPQGQEGQGQGQVNIPIPSKPQSQPQTQGQGQQGRSRSGVVVDEDGFEMKVKSGSNRGSRGGQGGEGRGGARGRGGGRGRGNGEQRGGGEGRGGSRGGAGRGRTGPKGLEAGAPGSGVVAPAAE